MPVSRQMFFQLKLSGTHNEILIAFAEVFLLCVMLTSYEAYFARKPYDVYWCLIAIAVIIFAATVFYANGRAITKHEYICPSCGLPFASKDEE